MSAASNSGAAAAATAAPATATGAAPYQSRSCLTAESGKLPCFFNKLLKMKGKFGTGGVFNNLKDAELSLDDLRALAWWLYSDVSKVDAECKETAPLLLALIQANEARLKTLALHNQEGSDAIAEFLTEALRVVNLATHNAISINYFYKIIKSCGVNFESDEDFLKCLSVQSFDALAYLVHLRKIRATMS